MKKLMFLILFIFGFNALASNLDIQEVKKEFYKTEKAIKNGLVDEYKKSKEIDGMGVDATLYKKDGHIVKLSCEGGAGDFYFKAEYFYRKNGKQYFSYIYTGGVNPSVCQTEKRIYFNKKGNIVLKKIKTNRKGCDGFPIIVKNPNSFYNKYCNVQ
jgi:hypothetical protein